MSVNNLCIIIGNLGQNPELRRSDSGTPVVNISLAVDRPYKRTNPTTGVRESVKKTDWIPVTCWGPLAENCHRWLKMGSLIAVHGALRERKYTDAEGTNHRILEVRAENVRFLGNIRSKDEVAARAVVAQQPSV